MRCLIRLLSSLLPNSPVDKMNAMLIEVNYYFDTHANFYRPSFILSKVRRKEHAYATGLLADQWYSVFAESRDISCMSATVIKADYRSLLICHTGTRILQIRPNFLIA